MNASDRKYLDLLQTEMVKILRQSYPAIPESMSDWMGTEITYFQDDLQRQQNETVSEKWFYTHMKSSNESLPRIDVLNILSRYAGYLDWADFKYNQTGKEQKEQESPVTEETAPRDRSNRVFYLIPILVLTVLVIFMLILKLFHVDVI